MKTIAVTILLLVAVVHGQDECPEERVACNMACEFGFQKDARGCDMCECLPEKCLGVDCGPGKVCRTIAKTDSLEVEAYCADPRLPERCQFPSDIGSCRGLKPSWFYDSQAETCAEFNYGGCQGNDNRFETEQECQEACTCSQASCFMNCPMGFKRDERGCQVCQCREAREPNPNCAENRPMCLMFCPFGFKRDSEGCEICQCMEGPKPDCDADRPMCTMHCPYGFKRDSEGCEICQCLEQPEAVPYDRSGPECTAVMCMMFCEHGYKKDVNGCNMCECLEPTCPDPSVQCMMQCEYGFRKDAEGCDECACRTAEECQGFQCRMGCPYGFLKDDNDCNLCLCHDPCQEKTCPDDMSCLVVDSTLGDFQARCVPEHFKERPWCSDTILCHMHCPEGFKSDHLGCPKCDCLDGKPECELPKCEDIICPFGHLYDENGCTTCKCVEDPCQSYNCVENQVCEAFKIKLCPWCPASARCIDVVRVARVRVTMVFQHDPLDDPNWDAFAEDLVDEISDMLDVEEDYIVGVVIQSLTNAITVVHFHILSSGSGAHDLIAAYEKMMLEIENGYEIEWEGTDFVHDSAKMVVSYSSQRDIPQEVWDEYEEQKSNTQTVVIICAVAAGIIVLIAVVFIFMACRRNKQQQKSNVAYSKTPQSENVRVKDPSPDV